MRKALLLVVSALISLNVLAQQDPRDDSSAWGISSGAEWSGDYPKFNPLLHQAGITWLRYFPEWQTIQPKKGEWNWEYADKMVADAKKNQIHMSGGFAYFAKFASADGGTRRGPIKDMQYWRDYTREVMTRYKDDIKYWEVWNEFNGSFYQGKNKPKEYADLVKEAYIQAKKIKPDVNIGMSCANFDLGFFDAAIKAGAADHFDFIAVHPYENLGTVMSDGGESGFLSMAGSIRKMLKDNKQNPNMQLWITEIGIQAPINPNPEKDNFQAEAIVKAYILSTAQGFRRLNWFEARGPAYGQGTDHGIIRKDWTLRPAWHALKNMTEILGKEPVYLGWLKVGKNGYGFVYQGAKGPVLVAWAHLNDEEKVKFSSNVKIVDYLGKESSLEAGKELTLTRKPIFIINLPKKEVELAKSQKAKPFPWGIDYAKVEEVSCRLGATNSDKGIKQTNHKTSAVINDLTESWRKSNFKFGSEGRYLYFRVDPTFASFGTKNLEITVVARRVDQKQKTSISLLYESLKGYRNAQGRFEVPEGNEWTSHTWTVNNANFVGGWGWNFRTDSNGSAGEIAVREVKVKRIQE